MSLIIDHITKTYQKSQVLALDQVSLQVNKGELFGLIGPDGAGKTTLFRILTTLLLADSGRAEVQGYDVQKDYKKIRSIVGYMPGRFSLYQDLTVEENLNFFATIFDTSIQQNYDLIRDIYVQLEPFKNRRAGKLSGGMKQKLALCCALIHRPEVLFLDEPTTGVDTVSRKEFWEMLHRLQQQGITIMVSTPYMDEATLCQRIALIQEGQIMAIDTPQHISASYPYALYAVKTDDMIAALTLMREMPEVRSVYAFGEYLHVTYQHENTSQIDETRDYLSQQGQTGIVINKIQPTIEDSFILQMKKAQHHG